MDKIQENILFATFGCWNKGCRENSGQRKVIDVLKSNEHNYNFMVILGDNYYSDKINLHNLKIKNVSTRDMKNGFNCLDEIHLDKKIILGNHDIEEGIEYGCNVLKYQIKLPWYDVKFPFGYEKHYIKHDNMHECALMLYLDTTIYEKSMNDQCYLQTINKSALTLQQEQKHFIETTLMETLTNNIYNCKQVIFYGHEPLYLLKPKKSNITNHVIDDLINIIFNEKNKYPNINFTWICADYHSYQHSTISDGNNTITQLVFGTGGGVLDPCSSIQHNTLQRNNKQYTIHILENKCEKPYDTFGISNYGYGEITISWNGTLTHKFIPIINEPLTGGYKKKYKKYKLKYEQLKNEHYTKNNTMNK